MVSGVCRLAGVKAAPGEQASSTAAWQPSPLAYSFSCHAVLCMHVVVYRRVRRRGRKQESRKLSFVENFLINQQHCWYLHGGGAGCPAQGQSPVVLVFICTGSVLESLQLKYETGGDM